jgi:uncharacterized oxidoreductase
VKVTGNTVLITGAGSGIGLGFAEAFAARGDDVIAVIRSPERAEIAARKGLAVELADVSDLASIRALADRVSIRYPSLNVLINNAGLSAFEKILEGVDTDLQEAIVVTNLLGYIRVSQSFLPLLLKCAGATIMNVSSALAFVPNAQNPTYCSTKAAIHSYTQSLRYQLKDTPVEVIEIIPPYVQTTMLGDRQAHDPHAQPLDAYIAQAMKILEANPQVREVVTEQALALRHAADGGPDKYAAVYKAYNDRMAAARP